MKETTRQNRKAAITRTALRSFVTRGYSAVSMDELAHRLGMSKGTLYRYFPSKEALLFTAIGQEAAEIDGAVQAIVNDDTLCFMEKLRAFLRHMAAVLASFRPALLQELQRTVPLAYEKILRLRQEIILKNLREVFAQGKRDGVCRADVDETLVAHMVIGTLRQMFEEEFPLPDTGLDTLFRSILLIILKGCLTPAGRDLLG